MHRLGLEDLVFISKKQPVKTSTKRLNDVPKSGTVFSIAFASNTRFNQYTNQRFMKMRILLAGFLCLSLFCLNPKAIAQPWTYDFGTGTGSFTSSTASTSFLPTPTSGTSYVRVGTNPGSIAMVNPGLTGLGTGTELQITSNTGSTSTTKFSLYDYAAGKVGYVKYKIAFNGGTNGVYKFSLGDGANFSDNNAMNVAQIFAGIEWTFGASNTISYKVLNNTTYGTTGISNPTTLFSQSTSNIYSVEVYANNTTGSTNYIRSGTSYSLTNATWDLWVDGTRVGTGLAKGNLGTNVNMDSYAFNHQNSATAPGTLYLDDIEYSNALPTGPDGIITAGEYGSHVDGDNQATNNYTTYMSWDNTSLNIGLGASGNNSNEAAVFYFDINPITPVNGGTNSDGSTNGFAYDRCTYDLPFRGDFVLYFKSGYYEFRSANGSGAWGSQTSTGLLYAESGAGSGQSQEIVIPWSVMPGGVRPTSFNWFSHKVYDAGPSNNGVYGELPAENPSMAYNSASYNPKGLRYYTVSVTTVGSSTLPMSRNSFTQPLGVTDNSFGAISVWDFTMNSSGNQIARLNSGGNWTIANNLIVNAGTLYFGSGGSGYGTTSIGNVSVTGGSLNMDQTNQTMNVTGNVSIAGGTLALSGTSGGDLNLGGNWNFSSGTFTPNNRSVRFNSSTAAQTLTGNTTFDYLTINNTNATPTVTLQASSAVTVNSNMTFTNGRVVLGANNFTLGGSATVTTPSTSKYFVTNSTGKLIRSVSTSAVTFDVGNSAYNPITLTPNTGASIPYQVRVIDAVTSPVPFDATKLINRYWSVTAPTAPANTLALQGQWNTGEANANYTAGTQVKVAYHNGTAWTQTNSTQAGANPYTSSGSFAVTSGDINSGITFGIGKDDGFITSAATYTWDGSSSSDWGTAANWDLNAVPVSAFDQIIIPNVASYTNALIITGSRTVTNFTVNANGTYSMAAGSSLTVSGTFANSSSTAPTFNCTSTLTLSTSGALTVPAADYGILNLAGGARTLTSGATTRICGNYTPGTSTTVGTSIVEFNGTADQSITAASNFATVNFTGVGGTVSANGNLTVATSLTIASGDTLEQASGTLTISSTSTNVNGTLRNSTTNNIVQTSATVTVGATGMYDHARNGGNVLTATWTAGSNCRITGCTTSEPSNLGQSFSDFTWKCMSQSASRNLSGGLTSVGRDLNITNTQSFNLGLVASSGSLSMTVGRDINISSGFLVGATGTISPTISVTGNLNITGNGGFTLASSTSTTGTATMTVSGSATISSTAGTSLIVGGTSLSKVATLTVTGLITKSGSGTVSIGQGTAVSTLNANGGLTITAGTVNVSSGGNGGVLTIGSSATLLVNGGTLVGSATAHASTINCNGNATFTSGTFTLSAGTTGTATFNLADNKTFLINGAAVTIANSTGIGNLNIGTNTSSATTTAFTISSGSLAISTTGSGTGNLNLYGDVNLSGGSITRTNGTSNVSFLAQGTAFTPVGTHLQTITQSGATVSGTISFLVGGASPTYTRLGFGSNINFGSGSNTTVRSGAMVDFGTTYYLSGNNFILNNGGNLITANVDGFDAANSVGSVRTTSSTYNAQGQYIYNGTAAQNAGSAVSAAYYLSVFNTNGVTLSANCTIQSTGALILNIGGLNGKLSLSNFDLTINPGAPSLGASIYGYSSTDYVVTNGTGRLILTVPGTNNTITFPVGATATTYNPISLNNNGGTGDTYGVRVLNTTATPSPNDATKLVERYWSVTEGVAGGSNLAVTAEYNSGEENVNFAAGSVLKMGLYTTLWSTNGATSSGSGPYAVTSSTNFSSVGTFGVGKDDGFLSPVASYVWNGSFDNSWAIPNNWTPNTSVAGPTSTDNVTINVPGTNTLIITGSQSITNFDLSGTGTFNMGPTGDLIINGDFTYSSSSTPILNCTSTFSIIKSTSQPIPAFSYGNLNAAGGNRVLANSGTIGICGTFTRGAGVYTTTGSTVNYNGSGAQTIAAGKYNNLTISNARGAANLTSPAGTIAVGGTFNISTLSAFTPVVDAASIFDFTSAGSQTIPAFYYGQLENSGNGARTLASSGVIDIAQGFTPTTATTTITGSTIRYSNTDAVTWGLTNFTTNVVGRHYNNLEFVGSASTSWELNSGLNIGCTGNLTLSGAGILTVATNSTANTLTVDGNLSISGSGTVRVSNTTTSTIVGTLNVTGNTTISSGQLNMVGSSSSTTVQGNFTTNDLTISGTGQILLDAASNTATGTVTVNGNLTCTSTTANAINYGSGTANANNTVTVKGNFTKSGAGTIGFSGTNNATGGLVFNGVGTQQFNYSGGAITGGIINITGGSTLQLLSNLTTGSSASPNKLTVAGTLDCGSFSANAGNSSNTFELQSTGTLITSSASGVAGAIIGFTNANTTWTALSTGGASFIFKGNNVNAGFSSYVAISTSGSTYFNMTWLGTGNLTLDKSIGFYSLNFTNSGLFFMSNFDITIAANGAINGGSFSSTKMLVTNGNGSLIRNISNTSVGIPFTWPIGETTGTTEYSPVTVGAIAANSIAGSIGFKVIDDVHPSMSPATSYLSRYWNFTETGLSTNFTLSSVTFKYESADIIVGPEASLKGNVYNYANSDWTQYPSSTAGSNLLTISSGIISTTNLVSGDDFTARIDVPAYYRTVNSGTWQTVGNWEVSSDPAFISPAPSTPSFPPNNINSEGITVRNGHAMTTLSTIVVDDMTIESGGSMNTTNNSFTVANGTASPDLIVNAGGTLQFSSASNNSLMVSSGAVIQVDGLMKQTSTASPDVTNNGTINIMATGTYEHARNAGIIPTSTWASGSLCLLSGITNNAPGGLGQSFHHFTVNSSITASVNCSGALQTINGDFNLTTNHASNEFRLSTGTAFTLVVAGDLIITNGILSPASAGAGPCVLTVNGTTSITGAGSKLNKTGASTVTYNFNGDFTQNAGMFDLNTAGSSNTTVNFKGNVVINGTMQRTNGGTHIVNFDKASGTQTLSWGGTSGSGAITWNIGNGSTTNTVQFLTNVPLSTSAHTFAVANGATLDFQDKVLTGTNTTFNLGATGTLKIGSPYGITTAAAGATAGNLQTLVAQRNVNATATYIYTGTADQNSGNLLPQTLTGTGKLTISNTGAVSDNTVTLTNTLPMTTPELNLTSGLLAIGAGKTLIISTGGTVNATGGDYATGSTGGMTRFSTPAGGSFTGDSNPFSVETNGNPCGVNFGSGTVTIQSGGVFNINAGGFVNTNAPAYSTGSSLWYLTGGAYDRGLEWSTTSGKGYPHHVVIGSSTLSPAGAGAAKANVPFQCGGNLTINSGANIYMDYSGNNMTEDLRILGNLNLVGNLSGSGTAGSDIFIGGNWTNNGVATANFFPNGRQVTFDGGSAQTIGGSNTTVPAFDYLAISNTLGDVTTSKSLTANNRLQMNSGKLIIGNNNMTIGATGYIDLGGVTSYIVTNGTGSVSQIVNGGDDWFPVGPSITAFGPVTLNQSGTGETINVRAINVAGLALPSYANAVNDTSQMVKIEWVMNESVAGANSLRTTFGWQGAGTAGASNLEGSGFDRTSAVYHASHNGTRYVVRPTNATAGSNPYYSTSTIAQPYTATMAANQRFVVGNINGILPCLQTALAGDWNTATNWVDLVVPPTGSSVCINHAMTLAAAPPNPSIVTINGPNGDLTLGGAVVLTFEPDGTFTNNKTGFNMTAGSVVFQTGTSTINGSQAAGFNNLQLNGNTTLTTVPTINNQLEIKSGGFILSANGPNYGASSTLIYNTGGSYNRSNEWSATSGAGYPANVLVTGTTALNLDAGTGVNRTIQGNMQINNGSSVTQGATGFNLTVPGNFTLNGSYEQSTTGGGDLILGGNWSSGATAVLTSHNRDVRFNGSAAPQTIANTASGLEFGYLTIDNTSTGVALLNTITAYTFRVNPSRTFDLDAAKIILVAGGNVQLDGTFNANTGTIEYTDGGNFTNTGTFNRGTSTVNFLGTSPGTVVGTVQTNFHNIYLAPNGGANFNVGPIRGLVSGTLELRAGSYVSNAPIYEPGSTLKYNGGGTYNRNTEWDPATLQNVEIANNTSLYCGINGTSFTHTMAGNLTVNTGSTFDMTSNNLANMTAPLQVGGNVVLTGTLKLSNSAGGDMEVAGDFTNNAGTFTCNDRLTTFNGSTNSSIAGSTNTTFCLLTVNKTTGNTLTAAVPFTASMTGGSNVRVQSGTFDLNNQVITLGPGSNTLRIDATFGNGQTLKTNGTNIGGFANYTSDGVTTATLGGKVDYSSSGAETIISPTTTYYNLWLTGGSTKSIAQSTIVAKDLFIEAATTLDFAATASTLSVKGDVTNNGTTTGSSTGKIEMNGTSTQNMTGNGTYRNLDINNATDVSSTGQPTISSKLNVLLGKVIQPISTDSIILGSSATLTETFINSANEHFVRGKVFTSRVVNTNAESFGGMGVVLTAGANLGTVNATRQSGTALVSGITGKSGIIRSWIVKPTVQPATPDRNITFYWPTQDVNSLDMTTALLFKRSAGDQPFEAISAPTDVTGTDPHFMTYSSIPSFSEFTVSDLNNPLPLDLLSFTGRNENGIAVLKWNTANEKDNHGFEIFKSTDGRNFESIGFVQGLGHVNTSNSYRFDDRNLKVGSYYKLVQRDANGTVSETRTVFISTKGPERTDVVIFPNPGTSGFALRLNGNTNGDETISVQLFGIDGKSINRLEGTLSSVNTHLSSELKDLAFGVYTIKIQVGDTITHQKWIKQ